MNSPQCHSLYAHREVEGFICQNLRPLRRRFRATRSLMSDINRINVDVSNSDRALVLGVGGGNDSVTLLILLEQLRSSHGFAPSHLDIAAMLPDFLEYSGYAETKMEHVWEVT